MLQLETGQRTVKYNKNSSFNLDQLQLIHLIHYIKLI